MLILHGDNETASRNKYIDLKKEAASGHFVIEETGEDINIHKLKSDLSLFTLDGRSTAIYIQNFFTRRPSADKKGVVEYLKTHPADNIVIWENQDVSSQLKEIPSKYILSFPLPTHLFKYLDTFSPETLVSVWQTTAPELLLSLISKHLHKLLSVQQGFKNFPDWQLAKYQRQVSKFSPARLISLQSDLLHIDYASKSSSSALSLKSALELWSLKAVSS